MFLLSSVVLCGATIMALTDLFSLRLRNDVALRFRWSLPWYIVRYGSIAAAVILAIDCYET